MMSMQDMFYGGAEPVWIVKEDNQKADNRGFEGGNRKEAEYFIPSSIPYYPYYYPDYVPAPTKKEESRASIPNYPPYYPDNVPAPTKKEESKAAPKKETQVVMKVPICCEECSELVEGALYRMRGVESVECDTRRERVTVIATTAAPADILRECKKVFRKSRMWGDNH